MSRWTGVVLGVLVLAACKGGRSAPPVPVTYDTSCEHDWECVPAPACCPTPCTSDVINSRDHARALDDLRCESSGPCPVAGPCISFEYLCVQHTCKIALANDPDYRTRQTPP
jgi:hypothetical protein